MAHEPECNALHHAAELKLQAIDRELWPPGERAALTAIRAELAAATRIAEENRRVIKVYTWVGGAIVSSLVAAAVPTLSRILALLVEGAP